jgi:hypothetical protein
VVTADREHSITDIRQGGVVSGALLQKLESVLAPYETGIACRRPDLVCAYELVYRRYVERGFVPPDPAGLIYHPTFGLRSSRTIATTYHGRTVGTVTIVGDNFIGLHIESTYPSEVEHLRRRNRALAELTCLAIEPRPEEPKNGAFFALTRFMYQYAQWREYDDLLLAVHPRHVRFYERWFRVYRFGPCRPYNLVQGAPAIACRIDLRSVDDVVPADVYQWYTHPAISTREFHGSSISPSDHGYLTSHATCHPQDHFYRAA